MAVYKWNKFKGISHKLVSHETYKVEIQETGNDNVNCVN